MNTISFNDEVFTLDEQGFLDPSDQWNENFAEGMANLVGIRSGLTDRQWQIVRYVRSKFTDERTVPVLVVACIDNRIRLHELRALFPTGYHRGVCKIAGINYQFMYDHNMWLTYETAPPAKPRYPLDETGYLADFEAWDEEFATKAAQGLGGGALTERHWRILKYLRVYFEENRNIPLVYEMCTVNDLSLEDLHSLFPAGYRRGACLLAGLPFFG